MASIFGHIAASTAMGFAFFPKQVRPAVLLLTGFCAFAPDLDVLAFRFGIPYDSEWGHRGWTHSVFFGMLFGVLVAGLFSLLCSRQRFEWELFLWCVLSAISHPLLDMLTNGGRGCALWWPLSTERLFFSFRPIQVSPISVWDFIGRWGIMVLLSELVWIGVPCLLLVASARLGRRKWRKVR
ncbi:MAG: metal-dependent hydrolase [Saprospiraceae bacterium]|nr:metal-dependent hydrolase [Saprospiraceae bacterium]